MSKWLRILFPEVQLFDYMKQRKKFGSQSIQNTVILTPKVLNNASPIHPNSVNGVKDVIRDVRKGVKSFSINTSTVDIDRIFTEIISALKQKIHGQDQFIQELAISFKKALLVKNTNKSKNSILVTGPSGTGKATTLSMLVQLLHEKKLLGYRSVSHLNLSLYSSEEIRSNFINDCNAIFQDGWGTVCITGIDHAESEIVQYIAQLLQDGFFRTPEGIVVDSRGYFLVCKFDNDASDIRQAVNKLPNSIVKTIEDYAISLPLNSSDLFQITLQKLKAVTERLDKNAAIHIEFEDHVVTAVANDAAVSSRYGHAIDEWVESILYDTVIDLRARENIKAGEQITIQNESGQFYVVSESVKLKLQPLMLAPEENVNDVLAELSQLIGLSAVKTFVSELLQTVESEKKRTQAGQKKVPMSLHMVFTGNPGTGKTTVARLISRTLKAMGLISGGQLVEVTRQDLVGQYLGSTAPKTLGKLHEALGGVLFIDEAYTLFRGEHDVFGQESIDTIVKTMEDHRENLVVILAGYTNEMKTFFKANSGLQSRFAFTVEFPDYTSHEMYQILLEMAESKNFEIDPSAKETLVDEFEKKQIPGRNDSGNGRLVRNMFEEAVRKQSVRLSATGTLHDEWTLLKAADFGITRSNEFNLQDAFSEIIGNEPVKEFVHTLQKQILADKKRKEAGFSVDNGQTLNCVFLGNPGTGKTTIARLLAQMLKSMGVIKKGHLVEVDKSDLVSQYVGQTATKTKEVVESALGGVLFIDEAYSLVEEGKGGYGREAIDMLVSMIENHRENLVVILAGYTEEMKEFMRTNPGLASRFPLKMEFNDYTADEMVQITEKMTIQKGFVLDPACNQLLLKWYERTVVPGKRDNGNGRFVRNTVEQVIRNQSMRIVNSDVAAENLNLLTADDFNLKQDVTQADALGELDQVVGLQPVKQFVRALSAQIDISQKRKELGLPSDDTQTLHMIFKGSPGTGKTTIARIFAKRLKELGVIKRDILIETDRSGLVAGYVGQTALKTRQIIEEALGGVLFIDEAYALAAGNENDFGQEAIDTLVKCMDDYRDKLVVVLAGYEQDMERFVEMNPGLRSRFPNMITFPDYNEAELLEISKRIFQAKGYVLSSEAEQKIFSLFERTQGTKNFGNGRFVRNVFEEATRNLAVRISGKSDVTKEDLTIILPDDIEGV